MPNPASEFASGFTRGLVNVLNQKRQEKVAAQDRQQKNAQAALHFLVESGQLGDIADAGPIADLAFGFGDAAGGKKAKAPKGQADPQQLVSSLLGPALANAKAAGTPGGPFPSAGAATPAMDTFANAPGVASTPPTPGVTQATEGDPAQAGRRTIFGVPVLSRDEVDERALDRSNRLLTRQVDALMAQDPSMTRLQAVQIAMKHNLPVERTGTTSAGFTLGPGQERYDAQGNKIATGPPKAETPEKPPTPGTFEDFLVTYASENGKELKALTTRDKLEARKQYMQADDRPPQGGNSAADTKAEADAIAKAIISGDQPPTLTGLYRVAAPVRAALAREGYDLTKATQDWAATQRYLATLNSSQQIRLRQATEVVAETVPLVRQLSTDLAKTVAATGRVTAFNAMTLAAARQGALGQDAQKAAVSLTAQIRDMQAELAVMFRGGYAATNDALKQAQDVLNGNWSAPALTKALDLIEKNARIRLNSIKAVGAIGGRDDNPYAPQGTQAAPQTTTPQATGRYDPATGRIVPVK